MIVYTPLWNTMKIKGYTGYYLVSKLGLSNNTVTRLKKNESVSIFTINAICELLECKVDDVLLYITEEEYQQNKELYDYKFKNKKRTD